MREEATEAIERKREKDCLESETYFKGSPLHPKKTARKIWDETS